MHGLVESELIFSALHLPTFSRSRLRPSALQDELQKWDRGVKAGIWFRPHVVATFCPSVEVEDFVGYGAASRWGVGP